MNDQMPPRWCEQEQIVIKCVPYNAHARVVFWIRPSLTGRWDLAYQEEGKWIKFEDLRQDSIVTIARGLSAQEKCDPGFIPLEQC